MAETHKCSYYSERYVPVHAFGDMVYSKQCFCYGTKECEICTCDGDETKCNFYPEKRKAKLCPCCNGKAEIKVFRDGGRMYHFIVCQVCGLCTSVCSTQAEAPQKWNRRDGK